MFHKKTLLLIALVGVTRVFGEIAFPDFMVSITRNGKDLGKWENLFQGENGSQILENMEVFRAAYGRNIMAAQGVSSARRIPKIVHQIWLGSPLPLQYKKWMQSWMKWCGWDYILWTDEEVGSFHLYNQDLFDTARSYGEKTDVLRLEILLHYGGLYVDVDFECVSQEIFDELGDSFDFYAGFEPIDHGIINGIPKICNAIIAAAPYHPLIKNLIIQMKSNWMKYLNETGVQKAGPDYFSRMILDYEKGVLHTPETRGNNTAYRNIYLPCTFFYPFSEPEVRKVSHFRPPLHELGSETAAIHYWSGSWRPKSKRLIELN